MSSAARLGRGLGRLGDFASVREMVDATPPDSLSGVDPAAGAADAQSRRVVKPNDLLQHARDKALVERTVGGDLEAFNEIVLHYQDYLFALVVRVVHDRESAADAVQEALFSCYRNIDRFRGDSFRSWLTRIALNAATDVLRYRKRRPVDPYPEWEDDAWQPPTGEEASPERHALKHDTQRVLSEALAEITSDQRTAIVMYDVEGFDYQEIADITGVSLGTVKSRIHRGRLALRDLLGDNMELLRE